MRSRAYPRVACPASSSPVFLTVSTERNGSHSPLRPKYRETVKGPWTREVESVLGRGLPGRLLHTAVRTPPNIRGLPIGDVVVIMGRKMQAARLCDRGVGRCPKTPKKWRESWEIRCNKGTGFPSSRLSCCPASLSAFLKALPVATPLCFSIAVTGDPTAFGSWPSGSSLRLNWTRWTSL